MSRTSTKSRPSKRSFETVVLIDHTLNSKNAMAGMTRTPLQQAMASAENALRALEMTPRAASDYCPHPADTVAAELRQLMRYLALAE